LPADGVFLGAAWGTCCPPSNGGEGWGWNASWVVSLLPDIDQQPLFSAYNFNRAADFPDNNTVGFTQLSFMICPSDSIGDRPAPPWGCMSYHGNHGGPGVIRNWSGTIVQNFTTYPQAWWGRDSNLGYFGLKGVRDGTTTTALFSEKLIGYPIAVPETLTINSTHGKRGFYPLDYAPGASDNQGNAVLAQQALAMCKNLPPTLTTTNFYLSGAHWSLSYPWHTSNTAYIHWNTPNGYSCYSTTERVAGNPWGGTVAMITAT